MEDKEPKLGGWRVEDGRVAREVERDDKWGNREEGKRKEKMHQGQECGLEKKDKQSHYNNLDGEVVNPGKGKSKSPGQEDGREDEDEGRGKGAAPK